MSRVSRSLPAELHTQLKRHADWAEVDPIFSTEGDIHVNTRHDRLDQELASYSPVTQPVFVTLVWVPRIVLTNTHSAGLMPAWTARFGSMNVSSSRRSST